jgi:hypothetical protein
MDDTYGKIDRRSALACMGWLGAGACFTFSGGVASVLPVDAAEAATGSSDVATRPLSFVQISDTHIGFSKPANPDPVATLKETLARIRALPHRPDFIVHTGDVTHLATPAQFDQAKQLLSDLPAPLFLVPGEHDIVEGNDPRPFITAFGKDTKGDGWFSFDHRGVHVVGLVNVVKLGDRGQGTLGRDQLDWLKTDLGGLSSSTPIVLLSHFPLWGLFPDWGWGTADAAEAFAYLGRFGSVTALNGHIHQIQRKQEGHMQFHAARSTAYPQPAPGVGPGPGPLVLPPEQLRTAIGYSTLEVTLASPLAGIDDMALANMADR